MYAQYCSSETGVRRIDILLKTFICPLFFVYFLAKLTQIWPKKERALVRYKYNSSDLFLFMFLFEIV